MLEIFDAILGEALAGLLDDLLTDAPPLVNLLDPKTIQELAELD